MNRNSSITGRLTATLLLSVLLVFLLIGLSLFLWFRSSNLHSLENQLHNILLFMVTEIDVTEDGLDWEDFIEDGIPGFHLDNVYDDEEERFSLLDNMTETLYLYVVDKENQEILISTSDENIWNELPNQSDSGDIVFFKGYASRVPVLYAVLDVTLQSDPDDTPEEILYESYCIAGISLKTYRKRLLGISLVLSLILFSGVCICLLLSRFFIRFSLEPLNRLHLEVSRLSLDNPSSVTIPHISELDNIAITLNNVLKEMNDTFNREKRFTGNIAHELRTPVSEIKTIAEITLKYSENLQDDTLRNLKDIHSSADHMAKLLESLFLLRHCESKKTVTLKERVELSHLVGDILIELSRQFDIKRIRTEIPPEAAVMTNATLFRIILLNLLKNALEYSADSETVSVILDEACLLKISNPVKELDKQDLACLFEPFWRKDQVRSSGSGHLGLGLSIVKSSSDYLDIATTASLDDDGIFTFSINLNSISNS